MTDSEALLLTNAKMPAGCSAHRVGSPPPWPKMSMPQTLKSGFWVACAACCPYQLTMLLFQIRNSPAANLGPGSGLALAQLEVGVDVSGGEEFAGPLQRLQVLGGLDAVDHLAVDEVPAERLLRSGQHAEGVEGGPL